MTTIPTTEPLSFIAGDTVKWTKDLSDYKPEDGWTLTYALVQDGNQETITATDNGDSTHLAAITAATSGAYGLGMYHWQAYVTKATERYTVDSGTLEVLTNFATQSAGYDNRSHVKKTLDALEATILGKASTDQLSVSINGRSISNMKPEDLIKWRDLYKSEYAREQKAEAIKNGTGVSSKIVTRFI